MPPLAEGRRHRELRDDDAREAAERLPLRLHRHADRPDDENTHRDFGPLKDGEQERYLSYYGIRRAIKDGATLEVHYIRDKVPFKVDEKTLNVGFEQMCEEMELEDEEAKDFDPAPALAVEGTGPPSRPRRDRARARCSTHFLEHPDPNGFKAQLVGVDRKACAALQGCARREAQGARPAAGVVRRDHLRRPRTSEPDVERFEYAKAEAGRADRLLQADAQRSGRRGTASGYGEDRSKWRPPLKILIVCDRLLTGFDAPVEQVMYLDKPLRDHNLLQAIARTNRPLPAMKKRTGVVVDYFGVFTNLEKALNFDESIREESLIDWDALQGHGAGRGGALHGDASRASRSPTRASACSPRCGACATRMRPRSSSTTSSSLERLWEAVSPDPCLYPHRHQYNWLCGIYVAHRRRQRGQQGHLRRAVGQDPAADRGEHDLHGHRRVAAGLQDRQGLRHQARRTAHAGRQGGGAGGDPDGGTVRGRSELHLSAARRTAAARQGTQGRRRRGGRASVCGSCRRSPAEAATRSRSRSASDLTQPGEYGLFTILRAHAPTADEAYVADCARRMVAHLRSNQLLAPGWSNSIGGRMRVEQSLLAESWNPPYAQLGFDPDAEDPPFLKPAVSELAKADGAG